MNVFLEEVFKTSKKALLLGIGGGGDIVGTIPTARLFDLFGIECFFGGLPWERSVIDPVPGPRKFDEIRNARKLNERIWIANGSTITNGGIRFAESRFSEIYNTEVFLVDLNFGVNGIVEGLSDAVSKLGIDLVVGVDVGGDSICFGHEAGLASPLADSMMVSALSRLSRKIKTILGLFGYGSDGELTFTELENSISTIAKHDGYFGAWGITHKIREEMKQVISKIPTEASKIPVDCASGDINFSKIRSGTINVLPSFSSNLTFYLSPEVICKYVSKPARSVINSDSLDEANDLLHKIGLSTEIDLEMKKYELLSK